MSKLLLNEEPLIVMPQFAVKVGLNCAIIVQQMHYWTEINRKADRNYYDGYHWTYNSVTEWNKQFPFWSEQTIQRTITKLEKAKIIVSANYNKKQYDRTKWYRVNYEMLTTIEESTSYQIDMFILSDWGNQAINLIPPIPETSTKTSTETSFIQGAIKRTSRSLPYIDYISSLMFGKDIQRKELILDTIIYYFDKYYTVIGEEHTRYKQGTTRRLISKLEDLFMYGIETKCDGNVSLDDITMHYLIDKHFENTYEHANHKIMAFINEEVLLRRYYEVRFEIDDTEEYEEG